MASFVALFDACVLYPAPIRDLLLRLATTDLFRARWTDQIHEEWIRSLLRQRPDISRGQLERTRALMDDAVPDCLVSGYEPLVETVDLPDPADRHVLAAAILCQAGSIVTYNVKHFPAAALDPHGIEAKHPDDFVTHLFDLAPGAVCNAVRSQRLALRSPPRSAHELLEAFRSRGLTRAVAALRSMEELL